MLSAIAITCQTSISNLLAITMDKSTLLIIVVAAGVVMMLISAAMPIVMKIFASMKAAKMKRDLANKQIKTQQMEALAKQDSASKNADEAVVRARTNALKNSFLTGLKKYKSTGRSLYRMPWMVTLGEEGAGKTEAILNSELGFIGGLTDTHKQEGGFTTLQWWFTEKGVLLDTSGRMIFNSGPGTQSREWLELLKLLKKYRKNQPVNGVIITLSAESLMDNTEKETREKAAVLNRQLAQLHEELGVRFPVFVLVTKCDLINGFREYFDHLTDVDARRQMLGWSNPTALDEPFNPGALRAEFTRIQQRFRDYRSGLLLEDAGWNLGRRRIDHFDALFDFPQALLRVEQNLMASLEILFSQAEWSGQSMFLRGVYMTSATQSGDPLDLGVRERFGEAASSVDHNKQAVDRPCFLRDVFHEKIFRERGLVTTADSVKRTRTIRAAAVIGTAICVTAVLAILTWVGQLYLNSQTRRMLTEWRQAYGYHESGELARSPIVGPGQSEHVYAYLGDEDIKNTDFRRSDYLNTFGSEIMQRKHVPLAFRFSAPQQDTVGGDLMLDLRKRAYRKMFIEIVYLPSVIAARSKILSQKEAWTPEATAALAELLRLEQAVAEQRWIKAAHQSNVNHEDISGVPEMQSLMTFALDGDDAGLRSYNNRDQQVVNNSVTWLYPEGLDPYTLERLDVAEDASMNAIADGMKQFFEYWENIHKQKGMKIANLVKLYDAILAYEKAENELLLLRSELGKTGLNALSKHRYDQLIANWSREYNDLRLAKQAIDQVLAQMDAEDVGKPLPALLLEARKQMTDAMTHDFNQLKDRTVIKQALADRGQNAADLMKMNDDLINKESELVKDLENQVNALTQPIAELQKNFWIHDQANGLWLYEQRFGLFTAMTNLLNREYSIEIWRLQDSVTDADEAFAADQKEVNDALAALAKDALIKDMTDVSKSVFMLAELKKNYDLVNKSLELAPKDTPQTRKMVSTIAADQGIIYIPPIPMSTITEQEPYENDYHPVGASEVIKMWGTVQGMVDHQSETKRQMLDAALMFNKYQLRNRVFIEYQNLYVNYWGDTVRAQQSVKNYDSWEAIYDDLAAMKAYQVNGAIREINLQVNRSLSMVEFADPGAKQRAADALKEVDAETALLSGNFDNSCRTMIAAWMDLTRNPVVARVNVLNMTVANFQKNQLVIYSPDEGTQVDYWNELSLRLLRALGDSSDIAATTAIANLADGVHAWPIVLTNDRGRTLNQEQIDIAAQQMARITAILAMDTDDKKATVIGLGARTKFPMVDHQIDRLVGIDILEGAYGRWFNDLRAVVSALKNQTPQLTWTMVVPDAKTQAVLPAPPKDKSVSRLVIGANRFRYFEIYKGEQLLGRRMETSYPTGNAVSIDAATGTADTKDIRLLFYEFADSQKPGATVEYQGEWSLLDLVLNPQAKYDEKSQQYMVPLIFEDTSGNICYYWIGVKVTRPLPAANQWPTTANWPKTIIWPENPDESKNPFNVIDFPPATQPASSRLNWNPPSTQPGN